VVLVAYKVGKCLVPRHRRRKRWSQKELADRIGKTKQTVHKWEDNESVMTFENALNVSRELGVSMEDLYEIIEVED
jgi:DNA-binding XRE family transcriptional regulator